MIILTRFLFMLCHLAKIYALLSIAAQLMAAHWRGRICGGEKSSECLQTFETHNSRSVTQGYICRLQSLQKESQRGGVGQLA